MKKLRVSLAENSNYIKLILGHRNSFYNISWDRKH